MINPTPFEQLVGQGGNVITTDSGAIMEYDGLQVQLQTLGTAWISRPTMH